VENRIAVQEKNKLLQTDNTKCQMNPVVRLKNWAICAGKIFPEHLPQEEKATWIIFALAVLIVSKQGVAMRISYKINLI